MNKGFTLVELLLVIAIVGIIFAFSAPLALNLYNSQIIGEAQSNMVNALQRAKHNAILQKNDSAFGIHFDAGNNSYILFQGSNYNDEDGENGRDSSLDEVFPINESITISGLSDIVFSKLTGQTSTTSTTTLTFSNLSREILIEPSGAISNIN